jgi:RNA polymerase sigma-70 factor (ECF subfamily)
MKKEDERFLAEQLAALDQGAWARFVGEYGRPLLAFVACRFGCGGELAEEIVQMTFVRCVKSIKTFDPSKGALLPWLRAVAANEGHTIAASRRGGQVAMSSLPEEVATRLIEALDTAPLPEDILERGDVRQAVRETLAALDARYSSALIMKYVDGMSVAEIASVDGGSEKAVESLLTRSRAAFKQAFADRLSAGERGFGRASK